LRADEPFDVERFQAWMLESISHREGLGAGLEAAGERHGLPAQDLETVILPSGELTSFQRLEIYSNMYYWRLMEVLEGDFPASDYVLGHPRNHRIWRDFIAAHPSTHYRLTPLGQHVSAFFAARTDLPEHRFLSDLARLEYLKEVVFEAPASPLLEGGLQALAPEQWAQARLKPIAAFGLLETAYPVNPFFQAVMDEDEPELPAAEPSWTLVWRLNDEVWRSNINRYQYTMLNALYAGESLGDALEACASLPDFDPQDILPHIGDWFAEWTADRVFSELTL